MKKKRLPRKKGPVLTLIDTKNIDVLYQKTSAYIDQARQTTQGLKIEKSEV